MRFYEGLTLDELLAVWRREEHLRKINAPTTLFHNTPAFDQALNFQFRDDDGNETGATFLGAVNSDQTLDVDTNYRVRFEVLETNAGAANNVVFELEYNYEGGGFTPVTATSPLQWAASANYVGPVNTTQQIGSGGTYIGANNGLVESAAVNDGTVDFAGNDKCEFEYCFTIDSAQVADTETIVVRVTASTGTGNSDTQTATITVNEGASNTTLSPTGIASTFAMGTPTVTVPAGPPLASLSAVRFPENGGHVGVFHKSSTQHYYIGLSADTRTLYVMKSTSAAPADGDWDEEDNVTFTNASDCRWIWAQINDAKTLIEIITAQDNGDFQSHTYTISSDTLTTTNDLAASTDGAGSYDIASTHPVIAFTIEAGGDLKCFHSGERTTTSNNGVYRLIRNAGTWQNKSMFNTFPTGTNGVIQGTANGTVNDALNVLAHRNTDNGYRRHMSGGTAIVSQAVLTAVPGFFSMGPGIIDSAGDAWFPYEDDTTGDLFVIHWPDSVDATVTEVILGPISAQGNVDFSGATAAPWPCMHLGYDGTVPHAFYSDSATGNLYWNKDASDDTSPGDNEVELVDAITCWNLSVTYESTASEFWVIYTDGDRVPVLVIADNSAGDTLSPTGIASTYAMGTPVVTPGGVSVSPSGIPSSTAFGAATVNAGNVDLSPGGIAPTFAFGTPEAIPGGVTVSPAGIGSTFAFGTPVISLDGVPIVLTPAGIASTFAFGAPVVSPGNVDLSPAGIASTFAFGIPVVSPGGVTVSPAGIISSFVFGTPVVSTGNVDLSPAGIASTFAFGTPILSFGGLTLVPTGIASTFAMGGPAVVAGVATLSPAGLASSFAMGSPSVLATYDLLPTGIAPTFAFGSPSVVPGGVVLSPTGIASTFAIGTVVLTLDGGPIFLAAAGIPSSTVFGTAAVVTGGVSISPSGIPSTFVFGSPTVAPGGVDLVVAGLASTFAFGTPAMVPGGVIIAPASLASTFVFGTPVLSPGSVSLSPAGVAPTFAFGIPVVSPGGVIISPAGIASTFAFGTPVLDITGQTILTPIGIAPTTAFGTPVVTPGGVIISPSGLPSTFAMGAPGLLSTYTLSPSGIDSTLAFGAPIVTPGGVIISPAGLGPTFAFGVPVLAITGDGLIFIGSTLITSLKMGKNDITKIFVGSAQFYP